MEKQTWQSTRAINLQTVDPQPSARGAPNHEVRRAPQNATEGDSKQPNTNEWQVHIDYLSDDANG